VGSALSADGMRPARTVTVTAAPTAVNAHSMTLSQFHSFVTYAWSPLGL